MTNQTANPPGESWRLGDRWRNTRPVLADGAQAAGVVVMGIVVAGAIGYFWPRQSGSTATAIAGVVLQWAGLAVVALGMRQMRRRFKRPSWFGRLWGALQRPLEGSVGYCIYLTVFEWDAQKAARNRRKHGVSFEEATTVFGDPHALDGPDLEHSVVELRFVRLGQSVLGRLLLVAYTERGIDDG